MMSSVYTQYKQQVATAVAMPATVTIEPKISAARTQGQLITRKAQMKGLNTISSVTTTITSAGNQQNTLAITMPAMAPPLNFFYSSGQLVRLSQEPLSFALQKPLVVQHLLAHS